MSVLALILSGEEVRCKRSGGVVLLVSGGRIEYLMLIWERSELLRMGKRGGMGGLGEATSVLAVRCFEALDVWRVGHVRTSGVGGRRWLPVLMYWWLLVRRRRCESTRVWTVERSCQREVLPPWSRRPTLAATTSALSASGLVSIPTPAASAFSSSAATSLASSASAPSF